MQAQKEHMQHAYVFLHVRHQIVCSVDKIWPKFCSEKLEDRPFWSSVRISKGGAVGWVASIRSPLCVVLDMTSLLVMMPA